MALQEGTELDGCAPVRATISPAANIASGEEEAIARTDKVCAQVYCVRESARSFRRANAKNCRFGNS